MRRLTILVLLAFTPLTWASADVYQDAVAHKDRSASDRERDAREFPAELLQFAQIKPGMKVADIFGGGGYYSELISYVVGPQGEVRLINNGPYNEYAKDALKERFTAGRLTNVKRSTVDPKDLKLGTGELDAAIIVLSYHDLYYKDDSWPAIDAANFLDQVNRALKPGGVFVVIDHAAKDGSGSSAAQDLHRIDEMFARKDISGHGFKYVGAFDKLRNPDDDRGVVVFNPAVRGKTDRFVHLYRKNR